METASSAGRKAMPGARPILYVHHRSELGGAPTSLAYLLEHLDRSRFEPHVYCPEGPVTDVFMRAGAIVHRGPVATFTHIWASTYRGRRWALFARELARLPAHLREFRAVLRSHEFALVHLNDSPLVVAAWMARRAGIPVVWHLRSSLPEAEGPKRSAVLRWTIRRLAAAPIAISTDVAASFDVGAEIVPNPVDLQRFHAGDAAEAKASLGLPRESPVVSFFGFLYPSKGYRDFLVAAALVRARGLDARFLVAGGAVRGKAFFRSRTGRALKRAGLAEDYEADAQELVVQLGLDSAVRFVPFTLDPVTLYQASDVVVAPSRGPELARPIAEASACGRAVVAAGSVTGAGLLLPDETGIIVPRRSPDALAAALERLLKDDEERMRLGMRGREHAEAFFDADASARQIMDVYERLLAR